MSGPIRRSGVTIKDVAARADVSQMTVSRVLNNKAVVSDETRERVRAAMRELQYRPNLMARNLATRSGLFIGLLYRNPSYGYLTEFLLGALEACRELGHYLVVEEPFMNKEAIDLPSLEARFLEMGIQAALVLPPLSDDEDLIGTLDDAGIDFIRISSAGDADHATVGIDDEAAAAAMTRYLIGLGHRRIAVTGGPQAHITDALRMRGFQRAMAEAGVTWDHSLRVAGDFTYRSGLDAATKLFAMSDPPTAIFAFNDDMASGAITGAYRTGLQVPEDVTVVGFDDTMNAASLFPPLTTVRQPIRGMARFAVEALARSIEGPATPPRMSYMDYEVVVRSSSGPPR